MERTVAYNRCLSRRHRYQPRRRRVQGAGRSSIILSPSIKGALASLVRLGTDQLRLAATRTEGWVRMIGTAYLEGCGERAWCGSVWASVYLVRGRLRLVSRRARQAYGAHGGDHVSKLGF